MKMKRRWEPARTDYSISLVKCPFADRHGGECEYYTGAIYSSRTSANREAKRRQEQYRQANRPGRFVVREHAREAGYVLRGSLTLPALEVDS